MSLYYFGNILIISYKQLYSASITNICIVFSIHWGIVLRHCWKPGTLHHLAEIKEARDEPNLLNMSQYVIKSQQIQYLYQIMNIAYLSVSQAINHF